MNENKTDVHQCEDCGITVGVRYVTCPYAEEIMGKEEWVYLCEHCERERAMDI